MSRIGKKVIPIPKGVKVDIQPGVIEVQGPKGKLRQALRYWPDMATAITATNDASMT